MGDLKSREKPIETSNSILLLTRDVMILIREDYGKFKEKSPSSQEIPEMP